MEKKIDMKRKGKEVFFKFGFLKFKLLLEDGTWRVNRTVPEMYSPFVFEQLPEFRRDLWKIFKRSCGELSWE